MAHLNDAQFVERTHNTARFFTETRHVSWVLLIGTLLWGVYGFLQMPQRKDPDIPIRQALALCPWPGASAEKIEELITRRLEEKVAENVKVDKVESNTRTGITAVFKQERSHFQGRAAFIAPWCPRMASAAKARAEGKVVPVTDAEFFVQLGLERLRVQVLTTTDAAAHHVTAHSAPLRRRSNSARATATMTKSDPPRTPSVHSGEYNAAASSPTTAALTPASIGAAPRQALTRCHSGNTADTSSNPGRKIATSATAAAATRGRPLGTCAPRLAAMENNGPGRACAAP